MMLPKSLAVRLRRLAMAGNVLVMLVAAACSMPPRSSSDASGARIDRHDPFAQLVPGMSADEVRQRVGAPDEIRPRQTVTGAPSEIWIYSRTVSGGFRQVAIATREVPYVDPFSGTMRMIQEPVLQNEETRIKQTIELLMFDGRYVEQKQHNAVDRLISG